MEASIRFARASDGAAIAFSEAGEGRPLIHTPWLPWSHVQLEWRNTEMRRWYEALAVNHRLVRYDNRGTGLSDSSTLDFSLVAQVRDLEAVVSATGSEKVDLFGCYTSGPAALAFAAQHPERVAHLVVWCSFARGIDYNSSPTVASIRNLFDNWEIYTETGAHSFVGWSAGEVAHEVAIMMREACPPERAGAFFTGLGEIDASPCLADINVPALVMHARSLQLVDMSLSRGLAATIPNARLAIFEGNSLSPVRGDLGAITTTIDAFLAAETVALGTDGIVPGRQEYPDRLTAREVEVLVKLAAGLSNQEIADDLVLSVRTVERHVANIYAKTNASGRAQATAYTFLHKLV